MNSLRFILNKLDLYTHRSPPNAPPPAPPPSISGRSPLDLSASSNSSTSSEEGFGHAMERRTFGRWDLVQSQWRKMADRPLTTYALDVYNYAYYMEPGPFWSLDRIEDWIGAASDRKRVWVGLERRMEGEGGWVGGV